MKMRNRWIAPYVVVASAIAFLAIVVGPAAADPAPGVESPRLFHCEPIGPENEVQPPPPLWEQEGKPEPAAAQAPTPSPEFACPAGDVAYPEAAPGPTPIMPGEDRELARNASRPFGDTAALERLSTPAGAPVAPEPPGVSVTGDTRYYYVSAEWQNVPSIGGTIEVQVADPEVNIGQSHSLAQMNYASGIHAERTVEVGWSVSPAQFGDAQPHLFTYVNKDKYASNGQPGGDEYDAYFTPISGSLHTPGESLANLVGGAYPFGAEYINGDWWVWFDYEWIGYLDGGFWNHEFTHPSYHSYYGEVFDGHGATTDMGNGLLGTNADAILMRHPIVYPGQNQSEEESLPEGSPEASNPNLYKAGNVGEGRHTWRIGGPGTGKVVPVPEVIAGTPPAPEPNGATLGGTVVPDGKPTTYHFEYGTSTSYGSSTATQSAGSGWVPVAVSAELGGLTSSTTYHYRVAATNEAGTVYGPDGTFRTLATWSVMPTQDPGGSLGTVMSGVSCVSGTSCVAVGLVGKASPMNIAPLAEVLSGATWSAQEPPVPGLEPGSLADVSCPSSDWCMAVGTYGGQPLAESWDGSSWSYQLPPSPPSGPGGKSMTNVSCVSSEWCDATGSFRYANGAHGEGEWIFLAHWNGEEWSWQELPAIAGTWRETAGGISCVSTTSCVIAGQFYEGLENWEPLVVRLSGTSWSAEEAPPAPSGAGRLADVSCVAAAFCVAPGVNDIHAVGEFSPIVDTWDGTSWTGGSFPEPASSDAHLEKLGSVSCFGADECVAAGRSSVGEGFTHEEEPRAAALIGGQWVIEEPPTPASAGPKPRVAFNDISCVTGPVCVAVGDSRPEGAESVTLAEIYK